MSRLVRTAKRLEGSDNITSSNFDSYSDAFIEFCLHSYRMKDLLIGTRFCERKRVERYVSRSKYLSQCANASNLYKHFSLNREQRKPDLPIFAEGLVPIGKFWNPFKKRNELKFLNGHKSILCSDFAIKCIEEWNQFLIDEK